MNVLVTGGTGFVGSHLIDVLLERGDTVTALVRSPAKAKTYDLEPRGVRLVAGDLGDEPALKEATAGQDVIYHVAGLVAARNPAEFDRANREGSANLLRAAATHGSPRFVMVSSMAAAGPSAPGRPLTGDEPPEPVTHYGRSKLAGEEEVRRSSLPWTILRPSMVYGPRDTEVLKVFKLARLGVAPVFGSGTQELSAVTGEDLARALVAAALADPAVGRTYYPCHPEIFTSKAFAQAVGRAVGKNVVTPGVPEWVGRGLLSLTGAAARLANQATLLNADKANEFFQQAWTGDPTALTTDTGWEALHDLSSGVALTAAWYRDAGWL
jgi:nucleoside-diphosphate-sugar epimerase